MTVLRMQAREFYIGEAAMIGHIQRVLDQGRQYRKTEWDVAKSTFTTSVRPNFLLLPTTMTVTLAENGPTTTVTARTTSQSLIVGDIFNFYDRYISEFFAGLAAAIDSGDQTPTQ